MLLFCSTIPQFAVWRTSINSVVKWNAGYAEVQMGVCWLGFVSARHWHCSRTIYESPKDTWAFSLPLFPDEDQSSASLLHSLPNSLRALQQENTCHYERLSFDISQPLILSKFAESECDSFLVEIWSDSDNLLLCFRCFSYPGVVTGPTSALQETI